MKQASYSRSIIFIAYELGALVVERVRSPLKHT